MRITWIMSALLYEISGRFLLEDIREETGADDGAFPDGMDSCFNIITYKYAFHNQFYVKGEIKYECTILLFSSVRYTLDSQRKP